ncbi:MAG: hypothetical protein EP312_06590, partial [Gammaproteobacteria bacterium]
MEYFLSPLMQAAGGECEGEIMMYRNKWNKSLTKNVILSLSAAIFLSITGNAFSDEIPNDCRYENVVMQNFSDMSNKNFKCKFIKKVVVIFRFFRKNGEPILLLDGFSGKELHKIREGLKSDLKSRIESHLEGKDVDATVDLFFNHTPFPLSDDMVVLSIGVFFSGKKISLDKGSAAIIADRIFSENYPNAYG